VSEICDVLIQVEALVRKWLACRTTSLKDLRTHWRRLVRAFYQDPFIQSRTRSRARALSPSDFNEDQEHSLAEEQDTDDTRDVDGEYGIDEKQNTEDEQGIDDGEKPSREDGGLDEYESAFAIWAMLKLSRRLLHNCIQAESSFHDRKQRPGSGLKIMLHVATTIRASWPTLPFPKTRRGRQAKLDLLQWQDFKSSDAYDIDKSSEKRNVNILLLFFGAEPLKSTAFWSHLSSCHVNADNIFQLYQDVMRAATSSIQGADLAGDVTPSSVVSCLALAQQYRRVTNCRNER
jgi:hypothetical protein